MAGDFASELESIAAYLRQQADGELLRDLTRAMRDAVNPVIPQIREGLRPKMPDRYADVLAEDVILQVRVRTARSPGVTLVARERGTVSGKRRRLWRLDRGVLEHPVFGDRGDWKEQPVEPGWFTQPPEQAAPRVEQALADVLERVEYEVDRRAAAGG
jgi:hypothetical protein